MENIYTGNKDCLTLHVRITKKCNADCSYCSSYEQHADDLMEINLLKKSLGFLKTKILELSLGGNRDLITVQYIGGELLTVPTEYLKEYVSLVKNELSPLFKNFKHGVQSNLIGSQNKVNSLFEIFDQNVGTSFDNHTEQRTVKKSPTKYRTIFLKNISYIKKNYGKNISGIVVLDKQMENFIHSEISIQNTNKRHTTVRPVFNGGSPVNGLSTKEIEAIMAKIYDNWVLKQDIILEPFYSYFVKRFTNLNNGDIHQLSGCPSQHNCATASLNLEPNGDLFVCLDMADSKNFRLGNTVDETFSYDIFNSLKERSNNLDPTCLSCDYFKECQGGCMLESIEHEHGMYGKTNYCSTWKTLFSKIDSTILNHNKTDIQNWLNRISKY